MLGLHNDALCHFSISLKPFLPDLAAMAKFSRLSTVAPLLLRRRFGVLPKRDYGSAALAQVDYDYYDYEEEEEEVYWRSARPKSEECVSGRGVHWVIIGEPGAKKHVYAERLSNLLQVPHISMGTLVRQELSPRSSLYKQVPLFSSFLFRFHTWKFQKNEAKLTVLC